MALLNSISIYPIKSLAGISVNHWEINQNGLLYDRQWMLVDQDNQFLSQRRLTRMALIKTQLTDNTLQLTAETMPNISLKLSPPENPQSILVNIWKDQCLAQSVSNEIDEWFSEFLQTPCRLVYQPNQSIRAVDPKFAQATDQVSFSDGYPFLIISAASLDSLNQAMALDLEMARFRPNLVISDCEAYAEDYWREITIGNIGFRLPKPCSRCKVPTIDPNTTETTKEPLRTLNKLRKHNNKVYFGQNAIHNQQGIISVGDVLSIQKTGVAQPALSVTSH